MYILYSVYTKYREGGYKMLVYLVIDSANLVPLGIHWSGLTICPGTVIPRSRYIYIYWRVGPSQALLTLDLYVYYYTSTHVLFEPWI